MPTAEDIEFVRQWLGPEAFPLYYPGSAPFQLNGVASGARGAQAVVSPPINNFPHVVYGVRIVNTWEIPDAADLADVDVVHKWVDDDQNVQVKLAQQNVTAGFVHQATLCGTRVHWHPFPKPYFLAGGNVVEVTLTRLTGYPLIAEDAILPTARVTLLTAVYTGNARTSPPHRVGD